MNTVTQYSEEKCLPNQELLKDCSWFSSQNMDDAISFSKVVIPTYALNTISILVKVNRNELVVVEAVCSAV